MKKTLTILLSLLMLFAFTATCLASPGNEKALAKKPNKVQYQKFKVKKELKQKYQEQVKKQMQTKAMGKQANVNIQLKDVGKHWAGNSINLLYSAGLINGYPDGTFKPDNSITEAESIALIAKLIDDEDLIDEFSDEISDDDLDNVPAWVRSSVKKSAQLGFLNLNRFHSNVQATRAQTAVWIAKAYGFEPVDISYMPFRDSILISPEDAGYIVALYREGIIIGTPGGNFNPNSCITRAELAAILERLLGDDDDDDDSVIESIDLQRTAQVEQGESITLKATVNYADGTTDNDVAWSSSDTDLATVDDDGVVTAADDETGTVTITARATEDGVSKSVTCKVKVVEELDVIDATLEETGEIGVNDGKVYQEYELIADGDVIDLDEDNISRITVTKDDGNPVRLTPNSDSTLWFNVQKAGGSYEYNIEDEDGVNYQATLEWTAPEEIAARITGQSGEHNGNQYIEYRLGDLDLSDISKMYQIKPDGTVAELSANSDSTLWFKTSNQQSGQHTFLIYEDDDWYSAEISFAGID